MEMQRDNAMFVETPHRIYRHSLHEQHSRSRVKLFNTQYAYTPVSEFFNISTNVFCNELLSSKSTLSMYMNSCAAYSKLFSMLSWKTKQPPFRCTNTISTISFLQVSREGKKRAESKFHGGSSVQRGKSVALSARYIRSSSFRRGQLEPPRENVANKATRYTGTSFLKHSMLHPRQGVQQPSDQTMEGANR